MHPPGSCPTEKARGTPANEKHSLDGHRSVTDSDTESGIGCACRRSSAVYVGVPFYLDLLMLGVNNILLCAVYITR